MMAKALRGRRHRAGPHHRCQGGPQLHARGQGRDQSADRQQSSKRPRSDARKVRFTTWTLRYNRSYWVQVDGLEQALGAGAHRCRSVGRRRDRMARVNTKNVTALDAEIPLRPLSVRHLRKKPVDRDRRREGRSAAAAFGSFVDGPFPQGDGKWQVVALR